MATGEEVEDFLSHHGVKGMHWGQHKSRVVETARKGNKFTYDHPIGVGLTAAAAYTAYQKRGKVAAAIVIASSIGAYEIRKHYNDPEFKAKIAAGKKAIHDSI
jgi:hypothetical protein